MGKQVHHKYISRINGTIVSKEILEREGRKDIGYYIENDPTEYKTEQDLIDATGAAQ